MQTINRVELNGQAAPRTPKAKAKKATTPAKARRALVALPPRRVALAMTVLMGVSIPLLSLALSTIAGTLARAGHNALAGAGLALTVSVLAVSLAHLSWAIADITKSGAGASWALAVTVDMAVVLCEAVHVFAPDAGLNVLATALMICVCAASMILNVYAFVRSR